MQKTILTPRELIDFASLDNEFPPCDLKRIRQVEIKVFRDCLGTTLYNEMKASLNEYPCENYNPSETYSTGRVVVYKGVFYEALEQTQSIPVNKSYWKKAPKFDKPCLEELWCEFLGEFLAYSVLIPNMPLLLAKIKNGTIVKIFGKDYQAGSKNDMIMLVDALKDFRDLTFENLVAFVRDNNDDGCYDNFKDCEPCSIRKKRSKGWGVA